MNTCRTCIIAFPLVCVLLTIMTMEELYAEEQCLKDAWVAFNKEDYEGAIKFSSSCIDDFEKVALREQGRLDENDAQCPATGAVSDAEKNKTFANGLLNDIATAFFIKGRSAEYLFISAKSENSSHKNMAEEAYEKACRYRCGRTWDPRGWFWSPCEAAADRLPVK